MNCTMFGDLNLNASRRFVSDSWVSCITARRRYAWRVLATATWLAEAGWVAVCHSRYCIKTTKRILKRFRPPGSLIIIFKLMGPLAPIPNSKGTPSAGALNTRGMGLAIFDGYRRLSQSFELCNFQWPWVTSDPDFKVATFFEVKYRKDKVTIAQ